MSKKTRATGTREWATHSRNLQLGCEHNCIYCYASANAVRYKKCAKANWDKPVPLGKLDPNKFNKKLNGTIMFPTTHDITPKNIDACEDAIEWMLVAENKLLIVSKPHFECIKRLCDNLVIKNHRADVLFRFTIGTTVQGDLDFWEPGAPSFIERMRALAYANVNGFKTSVSCEPLLTQDIPGTKRLVEQLRPFVNDAIWLGRANQLKARLTLNEADELAHKTAVILEHIWGKNNVERLYALYKDDPIIKWKNSVKEMVGLPLNDEIGKDV